MKQIANRVLDYLATFTKVLSMAAAGLMATIVIIGVVARYVFNSPLMWVDEYVTYFMVAVSLLGANYVLKENGHITVDFITRLLRPKVQAWLRAITDIVSILVLIVVLIQVTRLTAMSIEAGTVTVTVLHTRIGFVQLMMPIGFGLLLIEFLRQTVLSFKSAISP